MYTSIVHKRNKSDLTVLSHITLEPPEDGAEHIGLYTTYETARKILLSPKILQILSKTFAPCDSGIDNYITKIVKTGFHIYMMEWKDSTCAFHQLPHKDTNGSIDLENIFISTKEVNLLPKEGTPKDWSAAHKRQVVFLVWYVLHEMCHAIGNIHSLHYRTIGKF